MTTAMTFNFLHAGHGTHDFHVMPEQSIDGPRYRIVFHTPQYELEAVCNQTLEFLGGGALALPQMLSLEYRLDLTGVDLGGKDLSGASLKGTKFAGVLNLPAATFDNLRGAILDGVDLAGVDLGGKDLSGV